MVLMEDAGLRRKYTSNDDDEEEEEGLGGCDDDWIDMIDDDDADHTPCNHPHHETQHGRIWPRRRELCFGAYSQCK